MDDPAHAGMQTYFLAASGSIFWTGLILFVPMFCWVMLSK